MHTISRRSALIAFALFGAAGAARADYVQTNLVSDGSVPAAVTDPNLIDPWGVSFSGSSPFWISNQASNFPNASTGQSAPVATLHSGLGAAVNLIVNIPNQGNAPANPTSNGPTGQVSTAAPGITTIASDFPVVGPNGGASHQASFIFANQDGSISAWAGGSTGTPIANTTATLMPTTVIPGASFTGLAIANNPLTAIGGASGVQIYAADQNSGKVDVFNSSWTPTGAALTDPNGLPAGFTAFNVQNIGGVLYVLYANQSNPFGGVVDEFNPNGSFIKRLIDDSAGNPAHGHLDQPWGIALAPSTFGQFANLLLIGNNGGDGWINAFDPNTGALVGSVSLKSGGFFSEGNLWTLTFGNGGSGGDPNILYFTAGLNAAGSDGLFGSLAVPEPSSFLLGLIGAAPFLLRAVVRRRREARQA